MLRIVTDVRSLWHVLDENWMASCTGCLVCQAFMNFIVLWEMIRGSWQSHIWIPVVPVVIVNHEVSPDSVSLLHLCQTASFCSCCGQLCNALSSDFIDSQGPPHQLIQGMRIYTAAEFCLSFNTPRWCFFSSNMKFTTVAGFLPVTVVNLTPGFCWNSDAVRRQSRCTWCTRGPATLVLAATCFCWIDREARLWGFSGSPCSLLWSCWCVGVLRC